MAANKKSNTKSKTSPAPASKTASAPKRATTAKPAVKKKTAAAAPAPAAKSAPLPVAISVKAAAKTSAATIVTARIDVGFGNALYLRGDGPGLSWEKGVAMTCIADDLWQIALGDSPRPFAVKFLVNDAIWSSGPDFAFAAGNSVTFAPEF